MMKKVPLYSRSRRVADAAATAPGETGAAAAGAVPGEPGTAPHTRSGWRGALIRHERRLWAAAVLALLAGAVLNLPGAS